MASPTSGTTENPELPRAKGGTYSKGTPAAAMDDIDASHSDERPSRGRWHSDAPPTEVLTGVLGEMSFYYGACWLHYRSAQRRDKTQ
jgi:hypothetical protein